MQDTDSPRPEWNLNSYKINYLGQRMIFAFNMFEQHSYKKSFEACASIRRTISNRLKAKETQNCKLYEIFIPTLVSKDDNDKTRITKKYTRYLDKYMVYLQKLIKEKGLDLSEKSESSLF